LVAGGVTQGARSMTGAELGVEGERLLVWTPMDLSTDG
jgi:hypothetical protein